MGDVSSIFKSILLITLFGSPLCFKAPGTSPIIEPDYDDHGHGHMPKSLQECEEKWSIQIHPFRGVIPHSEDRHILESCLFYFIKWQQEQHGDGALSSWLWMAPTKNADDTLPVIVHNGTVEALNDLYGDLATIAVEGELILGWTDSRFKWQPQQWHQDWLTIKDIADIWVPKLRSTTIRVNKDSEDYGMIYDHDVRVRYTGEVICVVRFLLPLVCTADYTRFPHDSHACISRLQPPKDYHLNMKFNIENQQGKVKHNLASVGGGWTVTDFHIGVTQHEDMSNKEWIQLKFTIVRHSSALKTELSVPVLVCVFVVILAPLYGDLKTQTFVKLFAILLQMLAMHFMSSRIPRETFKGSTPRIYQFYEFSIVFSACSMCLTALLMAIGRFRRRLPPPHGLFLASVATNRYMCCASEPEESDVASSRVHQYRESNGGQNGGQANPPTQQPSTFVDYSNDWVTVFTAANNLISLLSVAVYVCGVVVLLKF